MGSGGSGTLSWSSQLPENLVHRVWEATAQDGVSIPHYLNSGTGQLSSGSAPAGTSQEEQSLLSLALSNVNSREAKISPKGCLIAIGKKERKKEKRMLFQGRKGEFFIPSVFSETLYLLIGSHSNLNKHIHHSKRCLLSDYLASSIPKHS